MTTEHRAEMVVKRGKAARTEEGNTEIGNGYGVPGGGAYCDVPKLNTAAGNTEIGNGYGVLGGGAYYDVPKLNTAAGSNALGQPESKIDTCSEQKPAAKELPEYLKQKLKARGILKDDTHTKNLNGTSAELMESGKLPAGWVEAKDPGSGAFYYYNESTGKSQWEKPHEASLTEQSPSSSHLPKNWVEALDETTGDHEYIDVVVDNSSGSSERLIIDIDFRSHFEIARAVDSYDRILNSLPVVYVGSLTMLKQFLGIMEEATRFSLKQNSMPLPPWRSLAYLQAKWQSPYERYTHSEGNINISNDNCFDHKQCRGYLKRLQSCLQSGMEVERMLKARNSESDRRMKADRWRHSFLRPL